jgi:diguanylate cyclase (GGDEF)-like protein
MPEPSATPHAPQGQSPSGGAQQAFGVLEAELELALQQDAHRALHLGREAQALADVLGDPLSAARAGSLLGAALYIRAEYTEAEVVLNQALTVSDQVADATGQRRCLSYLGYLTHAGGRHAEAIRYFLRLMASGHTPGASLSPEDAWLHQAEAHGGLSMVYSELGDVASSLEHQLGALAARRQLGHPAGNPGALSMDLSNISVDYRDLGNLSESERYCQEALRLARSVGDIRSETAALSNLGLTYLAQGRPDEAGPLFERLLELARQAGLIRRVMWGLHGLAELHLVGGHPERAQPYLQEALSLSQERALRSEEIDTWLLLGRSQQGAAAVASLERALDLAHQNRNLRAEASARLALADAYEVNAEPGQALAQLRGYLLVRDERESALTEQRAQVLAVRFGAEESRRENERLQVQARQLEDTAQRDLLTGLLNRRGLEPHLETALAQAQMLSTPLCLAVLDLDDFKQVNDRYSHQVGDEVLRAAAHLLLAGCRRGDVVGRYGGEEFVILFPGTSLDVAALRLEALRGQVQQYPWAQLQPGLTMTVSIGVTQLEAHRPATAATLIAAADACMYAAKRDGRNRVVVG